MKNKYIASLFAFVAGSIGVHKIYLGKWKQAIFYFLFAWSGIPLVIGLIEGTKYLIQAESSFDRKWNKQLSLSESNINPRMKLSAVREEIDMLQEWKERGIITQEDVVRRSRQILRGQSNFKKA